MTKENFWDWFEKNRTHLENLISEKTDEYEIYDILSDKLKQYNEFLIPEITINEDDKFVLVISCDGMKEGIPFAETLTENLRDFDDWVILKFRQPGPMELIPVNGLNLKRRDMFLEWYKTSEQKYHLTFFVKGYRASDPRYEMGTILHMDHTIGEYNAMTRVEDVEIKKLGLFQSKKNLKTLDDLKIEIDSNSIN